MTSTAPAIRPAAPVADPEPVVLAVTGFGVLCGAGIGPAALTAALAGQGPGPVVMTGLYDDPLPSPEAFGLPDFSAREHLGRKGTSTMDRSTALALVACGLALADAGLTVDQSNAERVGAVLGTSAGSVPSTGDFSKATFVEDRPYLVNPLSFPNAVMNCAAAQTGIRYGLKGPNTTVAGGGTAALGALRYARTLIGAGRADTLLVGAVEEFGPQLAWTNSFAMQAEGTDLATGEGSAIFVIEDAAVVSRQGRRADAEILAIEAATHQPERGRDPEDFSATLGRCITTALQRAGVRGEPVWAVASAENGMARIDGFEDDAITAAVPGSPRRVAVKLVTGEAASASNALQLAALLALHREQPALDGLLSVITARTADGAVAAAVVRGWSRR